MWNSQSDDMQVLMTRTISADEEEYLINSTDQAPPSVVKEVVKVRRRRRALAQPRRG